MFDKDGVMGIDNLNNLIKDESSISYDLTDARSMLEGLYNSNPSEAMSDGISPEMFKDSSPKDTGGGAGTLERPSGDRVPDKVPQLAGGGGGNDNMAPPGDGGGGSGDGGSGDSSAKMTQDEKFSLMGMFCKHSLGSLLPPAKME